MGQQNSNFLTKENGYIRINKVRGAVLDSNISELVKLLQSQKNVETLTMLLSDNQITSEGAKQLGKELAKLNLFSSITISLSGNLSIGGVGAANLIRELSAATKLTYLDLSLSRINIEPQEMILIGKEIQKLNLTTFSVYLSGNHISAGMKDFGAGLAKCKFKVLKLYINYIKFETVDADDFINELSKKQDLVFLSLNMDNMNGIYASNYRHKFYKLRRLVMFTK